MSLEKLVTRYIDSATHALETIKMIEKPSYLDTSNVGRVLESARAYLEDAKYFRDEGRFEVSLTSVAYCEGLLDALKALGAVKLEWPSKPEVKREK